jgi:hypothetical protein
MDWTAFIKSDGGSSGDREMGLKRIVTCLEALLATSIDRFSDVWGLD